MLSFRKLVRSTVLAAIVALGGTQAHAGLTQVRTTPHATEQGIAQILGQQYGGSFAISGNGFTNGLVTATRIDDNIDGLWTGGLVNFTPVASFSRSEQSLGLKLLGGSNGQNLFTINQFGYLDPTTTTIDLGGDVWKLTLDNSTTNLRSASMSNPGGDQLVTYRINGLGDKGNTFLMFWEDTPANEGDADYNDLVVQAQFLGAGGPAAAVPLPPAALIGMVTLGGAGMYSAWKRRKASAA
jgi:hypothetical protein